MAVAIPYFRTHSVTARPSSLSISPPSAIISVGQTIQLTAVMVSRVAVTGHDVTWTTSNSAVATVSQQGLATGISAGPSVAICVTVGGVQACASIVVKPAIVVPNVAQLRQEVAQLQEGLEDDFFTKLVKINFKYIDIYYQQTQSQADKSFLLCLAVSILGLVIIAAGVVLMFLGQTAPAYVTTSAGVVGEFIGSVFFYLYNRTILKMSEYHRKLVLTQNISIALKIAQGLPEAARTRAQETLIASLTADVNRLLVTDDPGKMAETTAKGAARSE